VRRPPSVNLGTPNIAETTRATRVKYKCIFPLGASRGIGPSSVTLIPHAVISVLSELDS